MGLADTLFQDAPPSDYPVRVSQFDRINIDAMRGASSEWQDLEEKRTREWDQFPKVMETFFSALFKPKPIREENLTRVGNVLRQILDEAENTKEWHQFRRETVLDEVASAIGAIALGKTITLPEQPPEGQGGDGEGDGEGELTLSQDQLDQIRREVRKAVKEAQQEVDEQRAAEALMWGMDKADISKDVPPEERIALANQIKQNERLRRLVALVGRMRYIAMQKHRRRVLHGRDELVDITLGNNMQDVIPQELMFLVEPDTELWFFWRWAERSLLQYRYEAMEPIAKGPIVAMVDVSGSMSEKLYGNSVYGFGPLAKIDFALAITLALTVIAQKEKRDLWIGFFNGGIVGEYEFPEGKVTPDKIIALASVRPTGGTLFEPPLRRAVEIVAESRYNKADILFITDGISAVSPEFLEWYDQVKKEKEFRLFSIVHATEIAPILNRISDDVRSVLDLQSGEWAMEAVFSL